MENRKYLRWNTTQLTSSEINMFIAKVNQDALQYDAEHYSEKYYQLWYRSQCQYSLWCYSPNWALFAWF